MSTVLFYRRGNNVKEGIGKSLATFMVILVSLTMAGSASAGTVYVNGSNGGSEDGTGWATGWDTIQEGVDDANAGDTVLVSAGYYNENVDIGKSINVIGNGTTATIVNASNANDHVFDVSSTDDVNISNLTATGATGSIEAGILLSSSDYSKIENVNASNNYIGILLSLSNNNTLTNNTANSNTENGIYLSLSSNNQIYNNKLNNTNNLYLSSSTGNTWNTTRQAGTNILGGPWIGGNYWANASGTGFSDTCTDSNHDGICDSNYTLNSLNVDYLPLTSISALNITIVSPGNTTYNTISITLNVTTNSQSNAIYSLNGAGNVSLYNGSTQGDTTIAASVGSNNLTVYANDTFGNSNSSMVYFTVDTTPPVASNPVPANNTRTSDTGQNISITLIDAFSDVNAGGIVMNVEGTDYNVTSTNLSYDVNTGALNFTVSDGTFTNEQVVNITVSADDNAGNVMIPVGWSFTVDTIAPNITVYSPENTTYTNNSILLNVTTNGTASVTYSLNGTANVSLYTDVNAGSANITVLDGHYNITYYATDGASDTNSGVIYFAVDTTPPVASNPIPANNTYSPYTGQNISITILDAVSDVNAGSIVMNVEGIDYNAGSPELVYDANTGALNFTADPGEFTNGQVVNITVDADDNAGNTMLQIGWSFTVETGAPAITLVSPTPSNGESLPSSTTTVTIKVNTIEASPDTLILNWGGTNSTSYSYYEGNTYWNKIKSVSAGNSYSFYVWVNDTNGSSNQTPTRTFSVQSSSSGSGNGGGDGGGDDTDTPETVTVTATVETGKATATISSASNGDTAKITIPTATDVFFTELSIKLKADISNAKITVSTLSSKPSTITETISGVVHSYIQVDKTNIAVTNVDSVTIKFKVPLSWVNDNNIDKTKVVLNRYSGGKWNSLTTTRTSETSSHIYYSATSPGLSTFGISGQVRASATTAPPATTQAPATTTPPPTTTTSPTSAPASMLFKAPESKSGLSWSDKLAIAMVIVLGTIAAMELYSRSGRWRYR